jgi:hypothetical protein
MMTVSLCLDNRLSDGGDVVRITHRPRSVPQIFIFISFSGTQFENEELLERKVAAPV